MKKTGYEWCFDAKIRVLKIEDWEKSPEYKTSEDSYFKEFIDTSEFYRRIGKCKVKTNSLPRKTTMYLEYRMYGLVPYNISPIQQGIQYGHAVVDYGRSISGFGLNEKIYNKWADFDKTFIILNGGTTNNNPERLGTLNKYMNELLSNNILAQDFYEPDLGDQLTAIVFLVDERVFDRETYPDFVGSPFPWPSFKKPSEKEYSKWEAENDKNYAAWIEKIGGNQNEFLRTFLRRLRLA